MLLCFGDGRARRGVAEWNRRRRHRRAGVARFTTIDLKDCWLFIVRLEEEGVSFAAFATCRESSLQIRRDSGHSNELEMDRSTAY